jgi:hypothetical protein
MKFSEGPAAWITAITGVVLIVLTIIVIAQGPKLSWFSWQGLITLLVGSVFIALMGFATVLNFKIARSRTSTNWREKADSESVTTRLNFFITRGHRLFGDTPKNGATASDFVRYWQAEMGGWSKNVATLLKENWGKTTEDYFFSTTGLNMEQLPSNIHPEAKADHAYLGRWLQNLENLRQTLTNK